MRSDRKPLRFYFGADPYARTISPRILDAGGNGVSALMALDYEPGITGSRRPRNSAQQIRPLFPGRLRPIRYECR